MDEVASYQAPVLERKKAINLKSLGPLPALLTVILYQ